MAFAAGSLHLYLANGPAVWLASIVADVGYHGRAVGCFAGATPREPVPHSGAFVLHFDIAPLGACTTWMALF